MTSSSWSDVTSDGTYDFFSIAGDVTYQRRWFINQSYGGCTGDAGWMIAISAPTGVGCPWETAVGGVPRILFSPGSTASVWANSQSAADVLAVFVR